MKKSIVLFSVFMFGMTVQSFAQTETDDKREKLSVALKGGVNLSNVYDDEGGDFEADAKVGLAAGASMSLPIGKFLGIQPEVLFSQKGYQASGTFLGTTYTLKRTLNYLDIPILFSLKPSKFLSIHAGPQFAFLMASKTSFTGGSSTASQQQQFDNDNLRKNTLGALVGLDLNVQSYVIGARAGWDLQDNNGDGTSTSVRYKNVWYQLTIGYRF